VENAEDGRSWIIQLTSKGQRMRKTIMKRHQIIVELFDTVVTPAESALLKSALRRLTDSMDDYVAARQSGVLLHHAQDQNRRQSPARNGRLSPSALARVP
jgi:Mn-dependent DtxR family transcriptional regulator